MPKREREGKSNREEGSVLGGVGGSIGIPALKEGNVTRVL